MKKLDRLICWLKSIFGGFPFDFYIDGHEWRDIEEYKNVNIVIAKCDRCEKQDITWSRRTF